MAILILSSACGGCSAPSHADANDAPDSTGGVWKWRNVNLQGMGDVNDVVVHPDTVHAPNLVYARTNVGGVYRLDPDSQTWIPLLDGVFGPLRDAAYWVEGLAIDPSRPDDVYVVVDGQVHYNPDCNVDPGEAYVSHDRGKTWTSTGPLGAYVFANDSRGDNSGPRLSIDPKRPGLAYFASHKDGLWKLSAGAWSRVGSPGLPPPSCSRSCNLTCDSTCPQECQAGYTFVTFDPTSGTTESGATKRIFVGVWTDGVFVSEDGGETFSMIGPDVHPVHSSVGPDGTLYVSFGIPEADTPGPGGVRAFRSTTPGQWTDTDITPPSATNVSYGGISADLNHAGTLVVTASKASIFRSQDGGATWQWHPVTDTSAPAWYWMTDWWKWWARGALVLDPNDPTGLSAWRTDMFAVSHTSDITSGIWATAMQGLEELVGEVVRAPGSPRIQLYAGVSDATGFADTDRTTPPSSNLVAHNGSPRTATSFDYCASKPEVAAFVGWDEANRDPKTNAPVSVTGLTIDDGATFKPFADQSPGYGGCVAIASHDPQNFVWEPTNPSPLYYTTDAGATWHASTMISPQGPPKPSFWRITQWWNGQTVASDRVAASVFYYISHSQGSDGAIHFWVSTDGGRTFVDKGTPLAAPLLWTWNPMIKPNPLVAGDVWISLGKTDGAVGGLYRSLDSGTTFERVSTVDVAYQVAFGKGRSATSPAVYVFGSVPGGSALDTMFRSDDLGKSWVPISDPSIERFGIIQYLEGDMKTEGLVYVATTGRGILYGTP